MLLPAFVETLLFYGGLAIIGCALLVFSVLRDEKRAKQSTAGNLPEASVVGGRKRAKWVPWALLGGGILVTWLSVKTTDVILVTGDGSNISATRKVRLFGSSDYKIAPGTTVIDWRSNPTWIVNESSRPVKVKTVHYGRRLGFGSDEPTVIPPGTAAEFGRVEHIGPSDPPPGQVSVNHKLGMDSRHWLLWD